MGIAFLVGQRERSRYFHLFGLARSDVGLLDNSQQLRLVDGEVDVDGIYLVDLGQWGKFTGTHEVAGVLEPTVNTSVKRRDNLGVVQVQFSQIAIRLGGHHCGPRVIALEPPIVHIRLGRRMLPHQAAEPVQFGLRVVEAGLLLKHLSFRLLQAGLVSVLLNQKQRLAHLYFIAVVKEDLFQIALYARDQLDRVKGLGVSGKFQIFADLPANGLANRDLWWRRRRVGILVFAA